MKNFWTTSLQGEFRISRWKNLYLHWSECFCILVRHSLYNIYRRELFFQSTAGWNHGRYIWYADQFLRLCSFQRNVPRLQSGTLYFMFFSCFKSWYTTITLRDIFPWALNNTKTVALMPHPILSIYHQTTLLHYQFLKCFDAFKLQEKEGRNINLTQGLVINPLTSTHRATGDSQQLATCFPNFSEPPT